MNQNKGDHARDACQTAAAAFKKLNKPEYSDMISRLEFCINSYDYDQNPVGLFEHAKIAYQMFNNLNKTDSRKIGKKLLGDLEKSWS
jgi:hypothetical protein